MQNWFFSFWLQTHPQLKHQIELALVRLLLDPAVTLSDCFTFSAIPPYLFLVEPIDNKEYVNRCEIFVAVHIDSAQRISDLNGPSLAQCYTSILIRLIPKSASIGDTKPSPLTSRRLIGFCAAPLSTYKVHLTSSQAMHCYAVQFYLTRHSATHCLS